MIVGEHLFILNDTGAAQCIEVKTGNSVGESPKLGSTWSSMVTNGERLYITTKNGDTFVLKATPKFEELARNRLGEDLYSSIAVSDGEVYIRTFKALWCIGKP